MCIQVEGIVAEYFMSGDVKEVADSLEDLGATVCQRARAVKVCAILQACCGCVCKYVCRVGIMVCQRTQAVNVCVICKHAVDVCVCVLICVPCRHHGVSALTDSECVCVIF